MGCEAYIAGIFEHETRHAPDKSICQLHAEAAKGALADAGLSKSDVDGYFCAGDAPGMGPLSMIDYMGLDVRLFDATEVGGSSYLIHVMKAEQAIRAGKCSVALITLGGKPRSSGQATGTAPRTYSDEAPDVPFEFPFGPTTVNLYAMVAQRHMHEFGTTSEQLAWIKVAASRHARHNPNAMLNKAVTVEDVVSSPMIASPLHRLDCCVITDGAAAVLVVAPEIARDLGIAKVGVKGYGMASKDPAGGRIDLSHSAVAKSGPRAFEMAGVTPADIRYASIYDSFTITVLMQLEDLGFCEKGKGGAFVADGNLIANEGRLAFNTDGGGLCNNHPGNRGGITKIIEAVRQLRGTAHPAVQVPDLPLAVVSGIGGQLGSRHAGGTLILERED